MNMRMLGSAGVLLFLLLGCTSGRPSQTESATAPGADIAAYASFGWLPASDSAEGATERPLSTADANLYMAIPYGPGVADSPRGLVTSTVFGPRTVGAGL